MQPFRNACSDDSLVSQEVIDSHESLSLQTFLEKAGFGPVSYDFYEENWIDNGVAKIDAEGGMAFRDSQGQYCLLYNCYDGKYEFLAKVYNACPIKPQILEIYSGSMKITKFKHLPKSVHRPNVYIMRLRI